MSGRIRGCSAHERVILDRGWELAALDPADARSGAAAEPARGPWQPAQVPGTVASSLRSLDAWNIDQSPRDFDAEQWCYRLRFEAAPAAAGERLVLGFDGLATLSQAWLNGAPLLESSNMFVGHECDVTGLVRPSNELLIRFGSVSAELKRRRTRPRWRTPMVADQQLRWIRTTLLGRTPGWSPPAAPVGPWRPVWLDRRRLVDLHDARLRVRLIETAGVLEFACRVTTLGDSAVESAVLRVEGADQRCEGALAVDAPSGAIAGELSIAPVRRWWPHTHGEPALYRAELRLTVRRAGSNEVAEVAVDLGRVGFRELSLERTGGDFALSVNGRAVFCRGACWTPLDCVGLQASAEDYRAALAAVCDAGMNMLRVPGPLVYESDDFLDRCDAQGILVWQDFMFANMDYPSEDEAFRRDVDGEVRQQLQRLQARPALALLCGNSEGGQQAAMSGAPRPLWHPPFFETHLAALCAQHCPDVPYCPSSTHGGAFPHESAAGASSYYGVGAYRLPLQDARRSGVTFASECLAFANVPEGETLRCLSAHQAVRVHHPRWKERVPRDRGAGWDFDDVRDHYFTQVYRLDPLSLRYAEHERYLELSRVVSGEVMAACFSEWRRPRSACRGALVWFLRDLWPGAGWGIVDATGLPKAAYYHLKRVLQPTALGISDEGTNGLGIHLVNDRPWPVPVRLEVSLFRHSEPVGSAVTRVVTLAAASGVEIPAADLYDGFIDLSYAYRFGAAPYDLMHARLLPEGAAAAAGPSALAEAFHFPLGLPNQVEGDLGLTAVARSAGGGAFEVQVRCARFAQSVHLEMPGFVADDQYFHLAPKSCRVLKVQPRDPGRELRLEGFVHAINSARIGRIAVEP